MDGKFTVERHGGKRTDTWRLVYSSAERLAAKTRFDKLAALMRRGGVRMLSPDGTIELQVTPPRGFREAEAIDAQNSPGSAEDSKGSKGS